jgi:hypothetical protein
MASKEPKTPKPSKPSKEDGLKIMSSSCGCTYLGNDSGVFIPPGIDSKQQTSHCGKMGGSSGPCDFL